MAKHPLHDLTEFKELKKRTEVLRKTETFPYSDVLESVMVSLINQDIHRRVFELCTEELDPPPTGYCLFLSVAGPGQVHHASVRRHAGARRLRTEGYCQS